MTADARRRAEEALAVCPRTPRGSVLIHADDLRALLAAGPEKVAEPSCGLCQDRGVVNAVSEPSRPVPCPNCWHAPRQSDAGTPCDGTYACRCKRHYVAEAPPPPSDAVREAAERLRRARESNFLTCTDSRVRAEGNRVLLLEVDALLATLATVTVPDDAAVREAAESVRKALPDHTAGGVHAIYVSATRLVAALDAQGRACRQRLPLPTEDGDTDVCGEPAVTVDENDTPLCREHGGTKR